VDIKEIKKLIDLMKKNGLTAFEMEKNGFRISLAKESGYQPGMAYAVPPPAPVAAAPATAASSAPAEVAPEATPGKEVTSPMVGTLYFAPSPESPPFVSVGQAVTPDTVVCIIEAMKVFNEIPAGVSGQVVAVLVENGHPVEFGQPLIKVDPEK